MPTNIPRGNIDGIIICQQSLDVASVAINTTAEQDFTVPGLAATDVIMSVSKPALSAGLGVVNWRVKAANTMSLTFSNSTAGAINPSAETYTIVIARPSNSAALTAVSF